MKCVDCRGPVKEGWARCDHCLGIFGSKTLSAKYVNNELAELLAIELYGYSGR